MQMPSNACRRSLVSDSLMRTCTRTVSPGAKSGMSVRNCAFSTLSKRFMMSPQKAVVSSQKSVVSRIRTEGHDSPSDYFRFYKIKNESLLFFINRSALVVIQRDALEEVGPVASSLA